jgi:hypothetical protein
MASLSAELEEELLPSLGVSALPEHRRRGA